MIKLSKRYEFQIKKEDKKFKGIMLARRRKLNREKRPSYAEQLKDEKWIKRRNEILKQKGAICSRCGSKEHLQVHHTIYVPNKFAWEYKAKHLVVLCDRCHKRIHGIDLNEEFYSITKN